MSTWDQTDEDPEPPNNPARNIRIYSVLKEAVLQRKPVLKMLFAKYGRKSLSDYISTYKETNFKFNARKEEFLKTFEEEAALRLGPVIAKSASEQLQHFYFVSTADHHGPICAPDFINSNLATAAGNLDLPFFKNIIVLSCANISLNNFSFPRGLVFHNFAKEKINTHRLSFLPSNAHSCTVYNFRSYKSPEINKIKDSLKNKTNNGSLQKKHADYLDFLIDEIYNQPEILDCSNYSDQITKTNLKLWKKFFGDHADCPNLVYLEQENIVSRLLIKYHLFNSTIINDIVFNKTFTQLIEKYFSDDISATYLFWALPKNSKFRQKLIKKNNFLVSEDGQYQIELKPEIIATALKNKELIPSLLMNFIILSFYYGVKCLGGPFQIHYLTKMKTLFLNVLRGTNSNDSVTIETCKSTQADQLCCDFYLSFLQMQNKQLIPATGLDIILYNKENLIKKLSELAKQFTLEDALAPAMPEYYATEYSKQERRPELANIKLSDMLDLPFLQNKIKPLACF